jgi:YesN/AraC family two-component response regulator
VLALSGHAGADTARRALAAGCAAFLVKPTPVQEVVAELERLVAQAPPRGTVEPAAS